VFFKTQTLYNLINLNKELKTEVLVNETVLVLSHPLFFLIAVGFGSSSE
jgi:hypothetical protein